MAPVSVRGRDEAVEYWRWRYRNLETGRICRTVFACSAEEASKLYPDAEPIAGTMVLRELSDEELDTASIELGRRARR